MLDRERIFTIVQVLHSHKASIDKLEGLLTKKDRTVENLHRRVIEQSKALARIQGVEYVEERPEGGRSPESPQDQEGPTA